MGSGVVTAKVGGLSGASGLGVYPSDYQFSLIQNKCSVIQIIQICVISKLLF